MLPRRTRWLAALLVCGGWITTAAQGAVRWNDVTREIYVDGVADREAQLFRAEDSDLAAVLTAELPSVVVFDRASHAVGTLPREALVVEPDRAAASTEALPDLPATTTAGDDSDDSDDTVVAVGEGGFLLRSGGHVVLITRHRGQAGEISLDELWHTVPVWRARSEAYEPDAADVQRLRDADFETELTLVLGTWCGDSKHYVPQVVKALAEAANPRIHLRLVSIASGFEEPLDFARDRRIINVPTLIVRRAGREIGRVVETPSSETFEADLAAILHGESLAHEGRWTRERRIARGAYRVLDPSGRVVGTEEWEVFTGSEESTFVHSRHESDGRSTEIFHRRDRDGVSNLVEITRRGGGELSRSRLWIDDGRVSSMTRGNVTGIVEQTVELPPGSVLLLPSAVEAVPAEFLRPGAAAEGAAFRLTGAGEPTAGRLGSLTAELGDGRRELDTPAGRLEAVRCVLRLDGEVSEWWIEPELRIPVEGRLSDGRRVLLTELDRHPQPGEAGP